MSMCACVQCGQDRPPQKTEMLEPPLLFCYKASLGNYSHRPRNVLTFEEEIILIETYPKRKGHERSGNQKRSLIEYKRERNVGLRTVPPGHSTPSRSVNLSHPTSL